MPQDEQYWNKMYAERDTGWDTGQPNAPLKEYIDQLTDKSMAILMPGAGNAYEAIYLMEQGFQNVTVVDIAPLVIDKLKTEQAVWLDKGLQVIHADFFQLKGSYDLVLEQTFFCAIDPAMRESYIEQMAALLKPSGKIAGVLFNRTFEAGPPFGGNAAGYKKMFGKYFGIKLMEPCYNSIAPRAGTEVFFIAQRSMAGK